MKYYKQIDGLRAFAVIAVIAHHWVSDKFKYASFIHNGAYGVDLFFVISGFVITTILLHEKTSGRTFTESIKRFYWRRSLRIFPIYYLYLLAMFCLNWHIIQSNAIYLLTYTFNLDVYFTGWPQAYYSNHLWSLSVEEQFYTIWPFIVMSLSTKLSFRMIWFIVVFSLVICSLFFFFTPYKDNLKCFSPYSFISLGLGALLAYARGRKVALQYHWLLMFTILVLLIILKVQFYHFPGKNILVYLIPFQSILFYVLVDKACSGFSGLGKSILENRILVTIGRISYGLYLYHFIIPYLTQSLKSLINNDFFYILINISLLLGISLLSWHFIEKPFNNLKDKFTFIFA